jgi:hypothetical protein
MQNVLVLGYGWSGSSAIVDLLREYLGVVVPNTEFRLIKDPYGLMDLRYNLVDRWDPLNVDIAIKNFSWFANCLNRKNKIIPTQTGFDYESEFGGNFQKATNQFLNSIVSTKYEGNWHFFYFQEKSFKLFLEKTAHKLHIIPDNCLNKNMFYSNLSSSKFDLLAKKYLKSIFSDYESNNDFLVLDQGVPTQDPLVATNYFDNFKIIIVDRDPRDNYCDLINQKGEIGQELLKHNDVSFYKDWFLQYRSKKEEIRQNKNVLLLSFEDLVFDYDAEVKTVEKFLGLSSKNHIRKFAFFNPKVSRNNIGIWKEYPNQKAINDLSKVLPSFINHYAD